MNNKYRDIILEEIDAADEIMNSDGTINFNSFEVKDELNPEIFDEDNKLKEGFLSNLINIYRKVINGIDFLRESDVSDVVLVGSLVSYHYSSYSDIDLHIIVDMENINEDASLVKEALDSERKLWNKEHDIELNGYEVEVYFQDINEKNASNGVYSLLEDDWVKFPEEEKGVIDKDEVERKALTYIDKIDDLEDSKKPKLNKIQKLWDKITNGRKVDLKKNGEFSVGNIVFKILRRTEHLKKLQEILNKAKGEPNEANIEIKESKNMKVNLKSVLESVGEKVMDYMEENGTNEISRAKLRELIECELPHRDFEEENEEDVKECGESQNDEVDECDAPVNEISDEGDDDYEDVVQEEDEEIKECGVSEDEDVAECDCGKKSNKKLISERLKKCVEDGKQKTVVIPDKMKKALIDMLIPRGPIEDAAALEEEIESKLDNIQSALVDANIDKMGLLKIICA